VSLALAKDQRLSLNPTQISGGCGRLLCCLRYEHDFYVTSRKRFPKEGKILTTSAGRERVEAVDIFRERVLLKAEDGTRRTVMLSDLKQEVAAGGRAERPVAKTTPAPDPAPDVTTEQAVDAVAPKRRRRRRRGRGRGRGKPPASGGEGTTDA
jgi:hypothetical protein